MGVPHTFGPMTGPIPLRYLDECFEAVENAGGAAVSAQAYMTDAQIAGVQGTGPLVDVIDALEAAIADVGDITWKGSVAAERPSAGGMRAGGKVIFPPGVYMISRTLYRPAGVLFEGQSGGGFFQPRANDASTANGNVVNVKNSVILAAFPAGSGAGQAGQMWVIDTANWTSAGARIAYNATTTGPHLDAGDVSFVPGGGIVGLHIDSVRDPTTGFHIANQIPFGAIRMIGALNATIDRVGFDGVDYGIVWNASWGYNCSRVFGDAFLGGHFEMDDTNAGWVTQVYVRRNATLDATAPRTISGANRLTNMASLAANANGLPEDMSNYRFGRYIQNANGVATGIVTVEAWDVNLGVMQTPYGGCSLGVTYSEAATIAPMMAVAFVGTMDAMYEFSAGSRYGYCWGLNCSFDAKGLLPRRLAVRPASEDPNRNIRIGAGVPDLYSNAGGGLSANMLTWSNDVTQGVTLTNMTSAAYSGSAVDQTYTAGKLTANGAGVASLAKSGANVAPITGGIVSGVDFGSHVYCHWADLKAGTAPTTAIDIAFSGGSASSAKAVIAWSGGVPTLTVTGTGATGFAQSLGEGWYRINIAAPSGNNNAITAKLYIGDGTTTPANGQTLYVGEHEVNPTLFPLAPIYNQSGAVPKNGIFGGGEHWEWAPGITYAGLVEGKIRVAASGSPYALGYDTGNLNTGTFMTLDAALRRISLSSYPTWEIVVNDGDALPLTANITSLPFRSKTLHFDSFGSDGHTWTLNMIATPSGTASHLVAEGNSSFSWENVTINMPSGNTSDATLCGLVFLQAGCVNDFVTVGLRNATVNLGSTWALVQQGGDSISTLHTLLRNTTINGTGTAAMHAGAGTITSAYTKVGQTSRGLTLTGSMSSTIGVGNGYWNCVAESTAIS